MKEGSRSVWRETTTMNNRFRPLDWSFPDNASPFNAALQPTEFGKSSIRTLSTNPELIVRTFVHSQTTIQLERERLNKGKKVFQQLEDFGLNVIPMDFVLGRYLQYGPDITYTITKRVHGNNLDNLDLENIDQRHLQQCADDLFTSLYKYYRSIYQTGGMYFADLKNEQFVYGRIEGDEESKIYLVDIDPWFNTYATRQQGGPSSNAFYITLKKAALMMTDLQKKLKTRPFPSALSALNVLLDNIPNSVINGDVIYMRNLAKRTSNSL